MTGQLFFLAIMGTCAIIVTTGGEELKISVELEPALSEPEVLIRCGKEEDAARLQRLLLEQEQKESTLWCTKEGIDYCLQKHLFLFFETEEDAVYGHTEREAYRIKERLYTLEKQLPDSFVRISKSTILNTEKVFSITRNITSSSLVQFTGTHKQVYVSRHYYKNMKERLSERSKP